MLYDHYECVKISQDMLNEYGNILVFNENPFHCLLKGMGVFGSWSWCAKDPMMKLLRTIPLKEIKRISSVQNSV